MSTEKPRKRTLREIGRAVVEEVGKIKFDRTPTVLSGDATYRGRMSEISNLYSQAEYWHGTGRYKYSPSGDIVDVLDGIIREGGLVPHDDDWDKKRGRIQTASVAPSRMYARLYAGMYCPAATRLTNELGTRELWGYYFFGTSVIRGMIEYRTNIKALKRGDDSSSPIPEVRKKTKSWTGKVTTQKHNIKDIFLYGTDIAENYPILLGIKKGSVQPTHGSKFINVHERRTESSIPLSDINHIEVPLARVQELESMLRDREIDIPVLPIEYGEEYCRNFSFRRLVSGKPLVLGS